MFGMNPSRNQKENNIMAANIQERDIQTGLSQAWHGLTHIVELITKENAGINYPMETRPLFIKKSDGTEVETDHKQIVSLDDELPIGNPVSDGYCLIDNSRIWDMVQDALIGMQHQIVSVGTVADRSKGFISVKLDEAFTAASRNTEPLLNLIWGHGGNISLIARSGFTVTVCENTFNVNLGRKGRDFNLSLKHTKNALDRIQNMNEAIQNYAGVVAEFKAAMDSFESVSCDEESARKIVSGIVTPDSFEREFTVATRTRNNIDRMVTLFGHGAGNKGETLADIFNAATDYYSHESSGGDNNRMKQYVSSEFGSGNRMKDTFFNTLSNEDELDRVTRRGEKVMMALANN